MMKLVAVALASTLALAVPAVGFAKTYEPVTIEQGASIRIVSVTQVGGSVDGPRAAAVAGGDVQPVSWIGQTSPGLAAALDRKNLDTSDVDAIYADANGTFWVFVDTSADHGSTFNTIL